MFMATCMETWIVADRQALALHYKNLQESALPPLVDLEKRNRHDVRDKLAHATRICSNVYEKNKRSFEVLGKLAPDTLKQHLQNFVRTVEILDRKL